MLKKFFLSALVILAILLLIALYRTVTHSAPVAEIISGKDISIDEIKASQNLAASIRFKTISYQDEEKFPYEEFNNFIKWASPTYPEFHKVWR
jgi:hypothetical protein